MSQSSPAPKAPRKNSENRPQHRSQPQGGTKRTTGGSQRQQSTAVAGGPGPAPLPPTPAVVGNATQQGPHRGTNATLPMSRGLFAVKDVDDDIITPFEVGELGHACQGQCDKGARCPFFQVPLGLQKTKPCKDYLRLGYCPREVKLKAGWEKQEGCNCSLHLCRAIDPVGLDASLWFSVDKENVTSPLPSTKMTDAAMLAEIKAASKVNQDRRSTKEENQVHRVIHRGATQALLYEGKCMDDRGDTMSPTERFRSILQIRNVREEESEHLKKKR